MSWLYFDSSALIKRYVAEIGSAWVRTLFQAAERNTYLSSEITVAEIAAALAAKQRAAPQKFSVLTRDQVLSTFLGHSNREYLLLAVCRAVIDQAALLTQSYKLRGYDAVQLASALAANQLAQQAGVTGVLFISADSDLLLAAQAEGLSTDNPNAH